jgi:hypothetical protein
MRTFLILIMAMPLFLAAPLQAVSYPPSAVEPSYLKDDDVMKVGAKLYLFHSGSEDVRKAISIGDVLTAFREYPPEISGITKESGKVQVTGTQGDYYFVGVVTEGFVEPGFIALKGAVGCLITTRVKQKH